MDASNRNDNLLRVTQYFDSFPEISYRNTLRYEEGVIVDCAQKESKIVLKIGGKEKHLTVIRPQDIDPGTVRQYTSVQVYDKNKEKHNVLVEIAQIASVLKLPMELVNKVRVGNLSALLHCSAALNLSKEKKTGEELYLERLLTKAVKNSAIWEGKVEKILLQMEEIKTIYHWCQENEKANLKLWNEAKKNDPDVPYIVLRKDVTKLKYNLEFRGAGDVRVRYQPNFMNGTLSVLSRHLDLYSGIVLVKNKQVIEGQPLNPKTAAKRVTTEVSFDNQLKIYEVAMNIVNAMHQVKPSEKIVKKHPTEDRKVKKGYLYLENMNAGDLFDALISNLFPFKLKCKLMAIFCRVLHSFHENGLIHHDVKPENFLIYRSAHDSVRMVLCDYDLTGWQKGPKRADKGTPAYLSPEQALAYMKNTTDFDQRIDIYALGVMGFLWFFGKFPLLSGYFEQLRYEVILNDRKDGIDYLSLMIKLDNSFVDSNLYHINELKKILKGMMSPCAELRTPLIVSAQKFDLLADL